MGTTTEHDVPCFVVLLFFNGHITNVWTHRTRAGAEAKKITLLGKVKKMGLRGRHMHVEVEEGVIEE